MPIALLQLTDGTTTINLAGNNSYGFGLQDWTPNAAGYKNGGTYQDSPLSDGRRLVQAVRDMATETFSLTLKGLNADDAIYRMRELRRLLDKAKNYWCTDRQPEPVWLVAKAGEETNTRYALVTSGAIATDDNPFAQPFLQPDCSAGMTDLSLIVERGEWLANPPGQDEAVTMTTPSVAGAKPAPIGTTEIDVGSFAADTLHGYKAPDGTLYSTVTGGRIYRSLDSGLTWVLCQTIADTTFPRAGAMSIGPNGTVYIVGNYNDGGTSELHVYKSTDQCANIVDVHTSLTRTNGSVVAITDDIVVINRCGASTCDVQRSINGGTTWTQVYTSTPGGTSYDGLSMSNGDVLFLTKRSTYVDLLVGTSQGTSWTYNRIAAFTGHTGTELFETADQRVLMNYLTGTGFGKIQVSLDFGATWTAMTSNQWVGAPTGMTQDSYGYLYTVGSGNLMTSLDGMVWNLISSDATFAWPLALSAGCIVGETVNTWEVYYSNVDAVVSDIELALVANKSNRADVTHVKIDDGGVFSNVTSYPATLLPATPAANDAIYFGVSTAVIDNGPFCSLRFNLTTAASSTTSYTITWEYWKDATPDAWATLTVTDNTAQLSQTGIKTVSWVQPSDWITTAVNGITGWWVRARVSALTGTLTPPVQSERICSIVTAYADTSDVVGDLPALGQITVVPVSDNAGVGGSAPNLYANRVICGLRTVNRGEWFDAYLNASDVQNNFGVTVTPGTDTSFPDTGAAVQYVTGKYCLWNPGGIHTLDTVITWSLSTSIARDYYGTFHAFMRGRQPSGSVGTGGIGVCLEVATGSGGLVWTSDTVYFEGTGDNQLLDFGRVTLPVNSLLTSDEIADSTTLTLKAVAGANVDLNVYDLVLIPTDEWAGDFTDTVNTANSALAYNKMLVVDSVDNLKKTIATKAKIGQRKGLVSSIWDTVANGPVVLWPDVEQRLWFLTARTSAAASATWYSEPYGLCQVALYKNERYFTARGNR